MASMTISKSTRGMFTVINVATVLTGIVAMAEPVFAAVDHYDVQVDGLACPFCAYGLEKKLKKLPGAANVRIELNTGWASFDVSSGVLLPEPVQAAVRDAGFTPRDIRVIASGTIETDGDELRLNVGSEHTLRLHGGQAFGKLRALVKKGHRDVVVSGLIRRMDEAWQLTVSEAKQREAR